MHAVVFDGHGGNEVVRAIERPDPVAGTREVVIGVQYTGVNPADVGQRLGRYPSPIGAPEDIGGIEVAGVVLECGPHSHRWQPGDRVFGLVDGGGFASRVVAHERCLARVPRGLEDPDAAAAPEAFITAHDALVANGAFRPGDRVLVNGASGGVGAAALQLVVALGGVAVGTCRSPEGLRLIEELGATAVTGDDLLRHGGEVVGEIDLVVELVGGPNLERDLEVLAHRGRIVLVGTPAGDSAADLSIRPLLRKRASMVGTTLRNRPLEEKAAAVRAFEHEVVPLLARRLVRSYVDSTFPFDQAGAAFDRLAESGKRGKVLLRFPTADSSAAMGTSEGRAAG